MKIYSYNMMLGENNVPYLSKANEYHVDGRRVYRSGYDVVDFIKRKLKLQDYAEEYFYCLCFDNAGHLNGCFEVSHGTVNGSLVSAREVLQKALMLGAVSIILTHNHPSGDPTPSGEDVNTTKRIESASEIIGIQLLDHIVVGHFGSYSMKYNSLF